jgi:aklavinone 12-hydroxylase
LFGLGFTMLAGAGGQDWLADWEKVAARLGIRGAGRLIDEQADIDGTFGARYCVGRAGATLVRPDGVIAWRANGPGDADQLESALRTILDRPRLD